jgi:Asp-tRNA(Asn)/Glu-tRNA(Gln) amidotransferase A subunit family amidase
MACPKITTLPLKKIQPLHAAGDFTAADLRAAARAAAALAAASHAWTFLPDDDDDDAAGPLAGVPVSVKDLFDVAGWPTSCGASFYAATRPVPTQDAPWVARWRRAGAWFVGKTSLNEFAYGLTGENRTFGDCTQPAWPDRLTGGSSSGAAASVAAGAAGVALGTDTGGSLRVPAALCGLVSFRASHGAEPLGGVFPLAPSFDTPGWLQRHLGDVALVAGALHPEHRAQPFAAPPRVAVPRGAWLDGCEPAVAAALEEFVAALRDAGAAVTDEAAEGWETAVDTFVPLQAREAAGVHAALLPVHGAAYDPAVRARLELGARVTDAQRAALAADRAAFTARLNTLWARHDFAVAPATPLRVLAAGADHAPARPRLLRLTAPASLARLPVLTVPWLAAGGPGIGFQFLAPAGADARLRDFAEWLAARGRPFTLALDDVSPPAP